MNQISFDVLDWVPGICGKNAGINSLEIPKLAKGGLAFGPTLAMVGDNNNASIDPEVIAPLSKLENMLESILTKTTGATGTHTEKRIYKIGETEIAEMLINLINDYQRQIGKTALEV